VYEKQVSNVILRIQLVTRVHPGGLQLRKQGLNRGTYTQSLPVQVLYVVVQVLSLLSPGCAPHWTVGTMTALF
jgi:hypothetical protein